MGQHQLLLIILGTIIVGVAVIVGINEFTKAAVNAEIDALLKNINNIGAAASTYWSKPAVAGGGARTFVGTSNVTTFGADSSNANGVYVMSSVTATQFTLIATGSNEGVVIVRTVTQHGVSGRYTITMP